MSDHYSVAAQLIKLAKRLLSEEPALSAGWAFGERVSASQVDAPSLYISNNYEIPLLESRSFSSHEYRMSMLAREGDMFVLRGERSLEFEKYRQQILGLGALTVVKLEQLHPSEALPLDPFAPDIQKILKGVSEITVDSEHLNLVPYIGMENIWQLATLISEHTDVQVHVTAPPPRLTARVNDKLWFAECVKELLGEKSLPPLSTAFGPSALTGLVSSYASRYPQVVVKVPDSAGSAGNMKIVSDQIMSMSETALSDYLQSRLRKLGWHNNYPVMVEVWDTPVLSSPSAQIWVPEISQGPPFIEGLFDQLLKGQSAEFVGATIAALPGDLEETMYFGRLSFDTVLCGDNINNATIHWIECNGRWGGVSIPMTLLNNLCGSLSDKAVLVYRHNYTAAINMDFDTALNKISDLLFVKDQSEQGIVLMNQHIANAHHPANIIIVANTIEAVNELSHQLDVRLSDSR